MIAVRVVKTYKMVMDSFILFSVACDRMSPLRYSSVWFRINSFATDCTELHKQDLKMSIQSKVLTIQSFKNVKALYG